MSDKTPKDKFDRQDGYDGLDFQDFDMDGDPAIGFPGGEPEDLTEEERAFSFDEDYLDEDFALPRRQAAGQRTEEEPSAWSEEAASPRENAVFAALKKLSARKEAAGREEPPEDIPPGGEEAGKKRGLAVRPGGGLSRRGKKKKGGYEYGPRAPVPIGEQLRSDEMLVYDSELDNIDYTDEDDLPEARDYMPVRFRRYGRVGVAGGILYGLFVISVSIVLACFAWMCASDVLALNKEEHSAVVTIEAYEPTGDMPVVNDEGDTIQVDIDQAASALKSAGIIEYKWLFKVFAQISDANVKMDPGTYDVSTALDYRALVTAMQFGSGQQEVTRVTFPEGYTTEQIFTLLEENGICEKEDLYEAAANYDFDYDFLEGLELGDPTRLEGYLFPDTYDFYQGESATVAISRFLNNTESKLTDDMKTQASNLGLSLHEAIIVASLVEKEAANDDERATIASVIYNRLNGGWKLQLDSTINYIMNTSTFNLSYADLETDSPYNTYMYEGLPAGPICNPGLASIQAALAPESTDYWFFYAYEGEDGWQTSFFTNGDDFNSFAEAHPYA